MPLNSEAVKKWLLAHPFWVYGVCMSLSVGFYWLTPARYYFADEAYLYARYAQNFLNGNGLGYNPHERILLTPAPLIIAGESLFALGQLDQPSPYLALVLVGCVMAGLVRQLLHAKQKMWAIVASLVLIRTLIGFELGGWAAWLLAMGLVALDIRSWRWVGLWVSGMALVSPLALMFALGLSFYIPDAERKRFWWQVFLPFIAVWAGLALYFGEGLRGLVLAPLESSGGIYTAPIQTASTIGYIGDHAGAFQLGGTVYHLDGRANPHLRALVEQGDEVGVILATAPDVILLETLPADSALNLLNYQPQNGYWQRESTVFPWGEPQTLNLDFGSDIHLTHLTLDRQAIEADGILRARLDWQLDKLPEREIRFIWQILDFQQASYGFVEQVFPPAKWSTETATTYHILPINPEAIFGIYQLNLTLDYEGGIIDRQNLVTVKLPPPAFILPQDEPLARFSDGQQAVALIQATLYQTADQLQMDFLWQAQSRFDRDYLIFVHLTRPDDPTPLIQADAPPLNGRYPTSFWATGEIIPETRFIPLTALESGEYVIRVGFFHPDGGRLPTEAGDSVTIGEIRR